MRYAAARREPNPASDPRSGYRPRLRASFKSAEDGGFPTPLVRPRLSRPFFGLISALWGLKMPPPRLHFTQKMASKGAARPPATRPECPATRETRGHLLNGGLPARRGLWTAPGTVPTARGASGLGSGLRPSAARSLNPLGIINSPPIKTASRATPPFRLSARGSPTSRPEKWSRPTPHPMRLRLRALPAFVGHHFSRPLGRSRATAHMGRRVLRSTAPENSLKTT